jgi:hypothetical protein
MIYSNLLFCYQSLNHPVDAHPFSLSLDLLLDLCFLLKNLFYISQKLIVFPISAL